ncbi:MAG: hypothetical protein U1A77_01600 [Pirellulales bacterium]
MPFRVIPWPILWVVFVRGAAVHLAKRDGYFNGLHGAWVVVGRVGELARLTGTALAGQRFLRPS